MKKWMQVCMAAAIIAAAAAGPRCVTARADTPEDDATFSVYSQLVSRKTARADTPEGDGAIADRIYIGTVSVGGLTGREAEDAVEAYVDSLGEKDVTLKVQDRKILIPAGELGLEWKNREVVQEAEHLGRSGNLIARYKAGKDLEHEDKVYALELEADPGKAEDVLRSRAGDLNREAVDFGLKRRNGEFEIQEGKDGIEVDFEQAVADIDAYFSDGWKENPSIELTARVTKPRGSAEELAKVQDKLGSFSTNYSSSAWGRKQNVANGCSKINGSLIYPGEEFSVYDAVSPFSAENGYELAGSYENGTTVQTYGGGICQVSTTLYNAVIRAELEVTERWGHSMIVNYVEPSFDAAIAGTYKNLKFKNNLDSPVYIEGYTDGSTIGFTIYGHETRPANREISFVSETLTTTQPITKYVASGAPVGTISHVQSSHTGKTAQLWKIVTVDGVEQSREVFNKTTYKMSPTIYEVGTSSSSAEAKAAMKQAIASQSGGQIRAAAAKWNAKALKAEEEKKKAEEEKKKAEEEKKKAEEEEQQKEEEKQEQAEEEEKQESGEQKSEKKKKEQDAQAEQTPEADEESAQEQPVTEEDAQAEQDSPSEEPQA